LIEINTGRPAGRTVLGDHRLAMDPSSPAVAIRALTRTFGEFAASITVVRAWIDPAQKNPKTIHHHG